MTDPKKVDWRKEWVRLSVNRHGIVTFIRMVRNALAPSFGLNDGELVDGNVVVGLIKSIDKMAPVSWNAKDKIIVIR
jgi:hypothetical protein